MSTTEAATPQGSVSPTENLDGWFATKLERREDAEAGTPEGTPSTPDAPAEPSVAETAPQTPQEAKVSWRDAVLDDVDHGFLKGKKAGELYESYRHSERAKQDAERRANELERTLQQIQQQNAQKPLPANPEGDPIQKEIDDNWFVDPSKARHLMEQQWEERQRNIAAQVYAQQQQAYTMQQIQHNAGVASIEAGKQIAELYGVDEEKASRMLQATWPSLQNYEREYGVAVWTNRDNYLHIAKDLFGDPPTKAEPVAAIPAPEIPNPPGNRKPATVPVQSAPTTTAIDRERMEARRALAETMKAYDIQIDPDRFAARAIKGSKRG